MMKASEAEREVLVAVINAEPGSREALEKEYGKVWDTDQVQEKFEVTGFMAPFVVVREKKSGKKGSLMFQHSPRFYFSWTPDSK